MTSSPLVSVILVNWNTRDLADDAIASLKRHERSTALEIIVVDNASRDGSADFLESRHPDVTVIRNPENSGFARGNNLGVARATGRNVLLLNTDTRFDAEVLPECLRILEARAPAIVGCRLLNADGSLQVSAERFPSLASCLREVFSTVGSGRRRREKPLARAGAATPVDWLCGAFLLLDRQLYLDLGGLSEDIFMYGEDVEFCWRARRKGVKSWYVPGVSITHFGGGGISHGSLRSLVVSDAGRLRSFTKMRGRASAALLRSLFVTRSTLRAAAFAAAGILRGDGNLRARARAHGIEVLVLTGVLDARRFI
jgi:GT2 family glycosyltransferase